MAKRTAQVIGRRSEKQISGDRLFNEQALTLYSELVTSRDRLAPLPPVTSRDLTLSQMALHEVVWLFMTPPKGAATTLQLPDRLKDQLRELAQSRSLDLYATVIALVAVKLARERAGLNWADDLDNFNDLLDTLTFDHRRPKRAVIDTLRKLKTEIDARIAFVVAERAKGFTFPSSVELYSDRKNKRETPDQFFRRVYAKHVAQGMTQADLRKADPAFYNVFHVWCSRNRRRTESFLPATRPRRI
ncbi:hypothetical protein [Rhodopseudomonas pseudopalustris]|uniref:Uncharacterized protein n=1 Tax=Rhodopseudomonas pseudopalustris TaxID=1513892 RepID=A0A1H8SRF5_9BRAD|nr:hypothetical protein [Rhodopseudomonas pseudopalustris]SEO80904.1 hypothetical protein SAMN05444123_10525 [Rhodopseudomonas pseudopalustris]